MDAGRNDHELPLWSASRVSAESSARPVASDESPVGRRHRPSAPQCHRPRQRWWGTPSVNLAARQPASHAIMFYLLSVGALLLFAPCVLVPIWRDVATLRENERAAAAVIAGLHQQVDRNHARIAALEADPLVIERVARRELNQRPDDEQHIRWTAAELAALRLNIPHDLELTPAPQPPAVEVPDWMQRVSRWLPAWATSDLFVRSPHRQMLLIMAGALLLAAFILYTPRAEHCLPDDQPAGDQPAGEATA